MSLTFKVKKMLEEPQPQLSSSETTAPILKTVKISPELKVRVADKWDVVEELARDAMESSVARRGQTLNAMRVIETIHESTSHLPKDDLGPLLRTIDRAASVMPIFGTEEDQNDWAVAADSRILLLGEAGVMAKEDLPPPDVASTTPS
jgi:hypothetical protein